MKIYSVLVSMFFSLLCLSAGAQDCPDFSGMWTRSCKFNTDDFPDPVKSIADSPLPGRSFSIRQTGCNYLYGPDFLLSPGVLRNHSGSNSIEKGSQIPSSAAVTNYSTWSTDRKTLFSWHFSFISPKVGEDQPNVSFYRYRYFFNSAGQIEIIKEIPKNLLKDNDIEYLWSQHCTYTRAS